MSENLLQPNSKEKTRGWLLPDADGRLLEPGLYLVASPIGNLRDVSVRALDTLALADGVLCEDSRVSGKLLKHYGISSRLSVYNDHSDGKVRAKILARIKGGEALALMSDAGMPLVSDPGFKLVAAVQEAGLNVTSVPGASAALAGLQLSGLGSDQFSFIGFLPTKSAGRKAALEEWRDAPGTLVAFETAPRLLAALSDIEAALPGRRVAVVRELTKLYEEVRRDDVASLIAHYEEHGLPKGEIVLVIEAMQGRAYSEDELKALLKAALREMGTKAAAAHVAEITGKAKKMLYALALEISR
ncbi:MAG: 16S rRNA (cytidine(1402)-2'-O)-methyltransferase [Rhodospirillales bacterium]|nr:16S rRNA (cytidine(1402)-2'-O)-methyltransferase [Rhodospirillales bacterium]